MPPDGPAPNDHLQAIVVEDDPLERLRIARLVSAAGFEVREAADVPEAIAQHARLRADVVVSDWQLPSMSGLESCRALATGSNRPHVIYVDIGDDCVIDSGPEIADSIMLPGTDVGRGTRLSNAIVSGHWLLRRDLGTCERPDDPLLLDQLPGWSKAPRVQAVA